MTNTALLRQTIHDCGYRFDFIASRLGLSRQGLMLKIEGDTEFKASEIAALTQLLGLSSEQRDRIFFNQSVNVIHE